MNEENFTFIKTPAGPIATNRLCGWAGEKEPKLLKDAFQFIGREFEPLVIRGSAPTKNARMMLWEIMREVIGDDTPNYPQGTGDCVAFGGKNGIEYVQVTPIFNGERRAFKRVFPPYLYATGRVFIGKRQLGRRQPGSLGIWQAKAVMEYGTIPIDTPGCPEYSGALSDAWGYDGPPDEFVKVGKDYIVKSAALVRTWDELVAAIINGYPVTVSSSLGFDMNQRSDGFFYNSAYWPHQMCIIGVDNDHPQPYACILNSWGDSHGRVKDFKTGEMWPKGTLRVHKADIEKMLRQNDSFAYSSFDGFPAQRLPKDVFKFI